MTDDRTDARDESAGRGSNERDERRDSWRSSGGLRQALRASGGSSGRQGHATVALAAGIALAVLLVAAASPAAAFGADGGGDWYGQADDSDRGWGGSDDWTWFGDADDASGDAATGNDSTDWTWFEAGEDSSSDQSDQDASNQWDRTSQIDWSDLFGQNESDTDGSNTGASDGDQSDTGGSDWFTPNESSSDDDSGWSSGTGGDTQPSAGEGDLNRTELEMAVHERVNEARADNGLGPLSFDEGLREIARSHSEDMAENDYFSHTSPSGETMSDRYQQFGYECRTPINDYMYGTGAENIFMYGASNVEEDRLAEMVVSGWMDSEGHRANILDENVRREGIGVAVSDDGAVYVTENFC